MPRLPGPAAYQPADVERLVAEPPKTAGLEADTEPTLFSGPQWEALRWEGHSSAFARDRALPPLGAGDLVAFRSAGAYGAVMASEYNSRPLVPEVLVAGDRFAVIRPRPSIDEMLGRDRIPDWL